MPAPLVQSDDAKAAIILAVFKGLERGGPLGPVLEAVGVARRTFNEWCEERPEWSAGLARVREVWAEKLVEECPTVARDPEIDPKRARVIMDANLKVAALLCPKRFSQAALDRIVAPPEEENNSTPEQIAAALVRAFNVANRAQLPAPVDAEFSEVDPDDV